MPQNIVPRFLGRLQEDSARFIWYRSNRVRVSTWFLGRPVIVGGADRDRSTVSGVSLLCDTVNTGP